jgi:hypothetical protein
MIAHLLGGLERAIDSNAPPEEIGRHLEGLARDAGVPIWSDAFR